MFRSFHAAVLAAMVLFIVSACAHTSVPAKAVPSYPPDGCKIDPIFSSSPIPKILQCYQMGEVTVELIILDVPSNHKALQWWKKGGGIHIATRERDFVVYSYSVTKERNIVEMACGFRAGCDGLHLPPDAGEKGDEACIDFSTCRICEKELAKREEDVVWAKECLTTGERMKVLIVSPKKAAVAPETQ